MTHGAINLAQGFPDFACPAELKDAAKSAIDADVNQYAITWGAKPFRDAIAAKVARTYPGWTVDPARALAWRPLVAVGRVSYGVYLYHWPIYLWLTPDSRSASAASVLAAVRFAATGGARRPVLRR